MCLNSSRNHTHVQIQARNSLENSSSTVSPPAGIAPTPFSSCVRFLLESCKTHYSTSKEVTVLSALPFHISLVLWNGKVYWDNEVEMLVPFQIIYCQMIKLCVLDVIGSELTMVPNPRICRIISMFIQYFKAYFLWTLCTCIRCWNTNL